LSTSELRIYDNAVQTSNGAFHKGLRGGVYQSKSFLETSVV